MSKKYLLAAVIALGMSPLATAALAIDNDNTRQTEGFSSGPAVQHEVYNHVDTRQNEQAEESHKKTPKH
jgi:hypothetical protein